VVKTREERYIEWLERLDIPVEETTSIRRFQRYLRVQFDITRPRQIAALWETAQTKLTEWAPAGVKPVRVKYPWGHLVRFAIKGLRGLFSLRRMRELVFGGRP